MEDPIALFQTVDSVKHLDTPDDVLPKDGSHYRRSQLETIWSLFGITAPIVPDGRMYPLIGELVENRNAVAHGRRTPEDVGSGYSKDDCYIKVGLTQDLCTYLVATLQTHCADPKNLAR